MGKSSQVRGKCSPQERRRLNEIRAVRNEELWKHIKLSSQRRALARAEFKGQQFYQPAPIEGTATTEATETSPLKSTPEPFQPNRSYKDIFSDNVEKYVRKFVGNQFLPEQNEPSDEDERKKEERRKELGLGKKKHSHKGSLVLGMALQSMVPTEVRPELAENFNFSEQDKESQQILASNQSHAKKAKALRILLERRRKEKEEYLLRTQASNAAMASTRVAWTLTSKFRKKVKDRNEGNNFRYSNSYQVELYYGCTVSFMALDGKFLTVDPDTGVVSQRLPEKRWQEREIMPFRERADEKPPYFLFKLVDLRKPSRSSLIMHGEPVWIQIVGGLGDDGWKSGSVLGAYIHQGTQFTENVVTLDESMQRGETRPGIVPGLSDWKRKKSEKGDTLSLALSRRHSAEVGSSDLNVSEKRAPERPNTVHVTRKKFSRRGSYDHMSHSNSVINRTKTKNQDQENVESLLGLNEHMEHQRNHSNLLDLVGENIGVPRPMVAHNPPPEEAYLLGPATSTNESGVYRKGDPGYDVLCEMKNTQACICGQWRIQTAYKEYTDTGLVIGGRGVEQRRADASFGPTWEKERETKSYLKQVIEKAAREKRESRKAASLRPSESYMFSSFEKASKQPTQAKVSTTEDNKRGWSWKKAGGLTGKKAAEIETEQKMSEELTSKLKLTARARGKRLPARLKKADDTGAPATKNDTTSKVPKNLAEALSIDKTDSVLTGRPLRNFSKVYLEQDWFYVASKNSKGNNAIHEDSNPLHLQIHSQSVSGSYKVEWRGVFTILLLAGVHDKSSKERKASVGDQTSTAGGTNKMRKGDSVRLDELLRESAKLSHEAHIQLQKSSRSREGILKSYGKIPSGEKFVEALRATRYSELDESEELFRNISRASRENRPGYLKSIYDPQSLIYRRTSRTKSMSPLRSAQSHHTTLPKIPSLHVNEKSQSFASIKKKTEEASSPQELAAMRNNKESAILELCSKSEGDNSLLNLSSTLIKIDRQLDDEMKQAESHSKALEMKAKELSDGKQSARRSQSAEGDFLRESTITAAKLATRVIKEALGLVKSPQSHTKTSVSGDIWRGQESHENMNESAYRPNSDTRPSTMDDASPEANETYTFSKTAVMALLMKEDNRLRDIFQHEVRRNKMRSFYTRLLKRHYENTESPRKSLEFEMPARANSAMIQEFQELSNMSSTDLEEKTLPVSLKMGRELTYKEIISRNNRPGLDWSLEASD